MNLLRRSVAARRGLEVMNALAAARPDNRLYREYAYEHTDKTTTVQRWETTSKRRAITKRPSPGFQQHGLLIPTTRIRRSGWVSAKAALERFKSRTAKSLRFGKPRTGLQLALELYRADPAENNDKLTDLADAYAAYGFAYAHLAQRPTISDSERTADWEQTRDQYQQSLNTWRVAQQLHVVARPDAVQPEQVLKRLARCNAVLAKRKSTRSNHHRTRFLEACSSPRPPRRSVERRGTPISFSKNEAKKNKWAKCDKPWPETGAQLGSTGLARSSPSSRPASWTIGNKVRQSGRDVPSR